MIRIPLLLLLLAASLSTPAQFTVSANQRYLLKDGKPFFWLGDTAWELFHRLNRDEADQYLRRRAEQGFTVIQAVVLAELDGLRAPNAYGHLPLRDGDPAQPNEDYFRHVDHIIDQAARYGLSIALLPTWGDKLYRDRWGKGPEIFNPKNAFDYGRWIGQRYRGKTNIIWVLGGDRNPRHDGDLQVWRSMARGILAGAGTGDGKAPRPVITFHPQPSAMGSATWFAGDDWISFHMFQTGHCRDLPVYDLIRKVYELQPTRPVMDGEPIYEDHPVCFNARDLGTSSAYDVRKAAYLALFAGAHGHTYGCHDIWQFHRKGEEGINGPHHPWEEALELPGANQVRWVRQLLESFPLLERVPDQGLLIEPDLPAPERVQATRGREYALVYSAAGRPFTVKLDRLGGRSSRAGWYDPRTGKQQSIGTVQHQGTHTFRPPGQGYGQDWVLVLDARQEVR